MSAAAPETATSGFDAPEIEYVTTTRVSCDGGGGALGHPLVWLTIGPEGFVDCPYCDKRFILAGGPADDRD